MMAGMNQDWSQDTALLYPSVNHEGLRFLPGSLHPFVAVGWINTWWNPKFGELFPDHLMGYGIKSFAEINDSYAQVSTLFSAIL